MVLLLQLLDLYIHLVLSADSLGTCLVVLGVDVAIAAHLVEDGTLLLHHLAIDGKEFRCLHGRQTSLGGDKLLQVGLELRRLKGGLFFGWASVASTKTSITTTASRRPHKPLLLKLS